VHWPRRDAWKFEGDSQKAFKNGSKEERKEGLADTAV
jgi:hypothetical protein